MPPKVTLTFEQYSGMVAGLLIGGSLIYCFSGEWSPTQPNKNPDKPNPNPDKPPSNQPDDKMTTIHFNHSGFGGRKSKKRTKRSKRKLK